MPNVFCCFVNFFQVFGLYPLCSVVCCNYVNWFVYSGDFNYLDKNDKNLEHVFLICVDKDGC